MTDFANTFGTGFIPDVPDERDYNYQQTFGVAPIDWSVEFRLPEPPNENQGSSDACTAYSTSYLHWQLKGRDFSRRDLFSRIAQQYGAYLRDAVKQITVTGQQLRSECFDPQQPNPANMRVRSTTPDNMGNLEASYFAVNPISIDTVAQAVRDHKGCIFGVNIDWDTWTDPTNPTPPKKNDGGHALYAMGYHTHDNQKCIIAKSSWCDQYHHEHHIKQDYFQSGNVFNPWCVVPKEVMTNVKLVKNGNELGYYIPCTSEDALSSYADNFGYPLPKTAEGKPDFPNIKPDITI